GGARSGAGSGRLARARGADRGGAADAAGSRRLGAGAVGAVGLLSACRAGAGSRPAGAGGHAARALRLRRGRRPGRGARPVAALPRRALVLSPENYLLLNRTLFYRENVIGQDVNTLVQRLTRGAPMDISASQLFVLSDSDILGPKAVAPQKTVIEAAIKEY